MKLMTLVGVVVFLVSSIAMSAPKYGMAGCGLGSLLIKKNTMMMQTIAMTLNATGYQPSAITTGTSNCVSSAKAAQLSK